MSKSVKFFNWRRQMFFDESENCSYFLKKYGNRIRPGCERSSKMYQK